MRNGAFKGEDMRGPPGWIACLKQAILFDIDMWHELTWYWHDIVWYWLMRWWLKHCQSASGDDSQRHLALEAHSAGPWIGRSETQGQWREDGEPWAVGLYFLSQWDRVRLYTVYTHVTCKSYIILHHLTSSYIILHHHLSTVSETFVCPVCRVVRWTVFFSAVSWGVRRFSQRDSQTTQRLQGIWMQNIPYDKCRI